MPNKLLLPENFAAYNFVSLAKKEPHPQNRLRLIAMGHLQDGNTLKVAASYIKVHWKTVQRWLTNFRLHGIDALYVKTTKHIVIPIYFHTHKPTHPEKHIPHKSFSFS